MATTPKKDSTDSAVKKKKAVKKKPAAPKAVKAKKAPTPKKKVATKPAKAAAKTATKTSSKTTAKAGAKKATVKPKKSSEKTTSQSGPQKTQNNDDQSFRKTRPVSNGDAIAEKLWRLVGMVAFALIGHFTLVALLVLSAMQFVVTLISEKPNGEIKSFMGRLIKYFREIFEYMSFNSNEMPFPFKQFPEDN